MSDVEQRSAEWLMQRVGMLTASRFRHVVGKGAKGQYLAPRGSYLWQTVIERLTGAPIDHYTSTAMQWGVDNETAARQAYERRSGAFVEAAGFLLHPTLPHIGGSPDGLIDDDGGWEAKCPFESNNHLECFLTGMPPEHMAQVQGLMWITGRRWWDFTSYDPRLPAPLDLYVQRIPRDDAFIAMLESELAKFEAEAQALLARLKEAAPGQSAETARTAAESPAEATAPGVAP